MSVAPITHCGASSSSASPNYNSCLGDACIAQSTVDAVVSELIKRLEIPYQMAVKEGMLDPERFVKKGNFCANLMSTALDVDAKKPFQAGGHLVIPYFAEPNEVKPCYLMDVGYGDVTQIDKGKPLGALVHDLYQKITALGIVFARHVVSVRFNKGYVNHQGAFWHRDFEDKTKRVVTISFGNIKEWSTHVLTPDHNQQYVKNYYPPNESDPIDSVAQPSRHGVFYNSVIGLHRAPVLADLGGQQPSADQWRLFFHFS